MNDLSNRVYVGDGIKHYKALDQALDNHSQWSKAKWLSPEPYIATPELVDAVNVALYLRRPLLLEGEPGCGKTRLAYAIAHELGYPLYECYIRSTSRAQDLLYEYDAVRRLYELQEKKFRSEMSPVVTGVQGEFKDSDLSLSREKYITLGDLGEAIKLSDKNNIPSVVLIDEIDKADIDFPNDLLLELDRLQFQVKEVPSMRFDALKDGKEGGGRENRKDYLPLLIITSNREKELPAPFLRRCLFYFIDFPDPKTLEKDERNNKITPDELEKKPLKKLPHLEVLVKTQNDRRAIENLL